MGFETRGSDLRNRVRSTSVVYGGGPESAFRSELDIVRVAVSSRGNAWMSLFLKTMGMVRKGEE